MLFAPAKKLWAGVALAALIQISSIPSALSDTRPDTFRALDSDSADRSCQVVLRKASLVTDPSSKMPVIETDPNGSLWYTFESEVDAATGPLASGTSVFMLYRASNDPQWHTAPGLSVGGAPAGLQRFSFRLSHATLPADLSQPGGPDKRLNLHLIPFLQTTDGRRIFDHNSSVGDADSVVLESSNNWSFVSDSALCPQPGHGSSTLRFLDNWTSEQRGLARPGQSLFIEYDLNRLPQCQSSSYNGLPAWQTDALIRFLPNGEEFSAAVNTLQNGKMLPTAARFEIPAGATQAQVWFRSRGRNCEPVWDSNFGRNYEFSLRPEVAPAPAWAGQWQMLAGTGQCAAFTRTEELPERALLDEIDLKSCRAIEAEVLVPGLTTGLIATPEALQAQVKWSIDGNSQKTQWLTFAGRNGQNYRFRWLLPTEILRQMGWRKIDYSFQFSTDGLFWLDAGRNQNRINGVVAPRTLEFDERP